MTKVKRKEGDDSEQPKKRKSSTNNIFTKQLTVSDELSSWLGGKTSISRPELTTYFWKYVKGDDAERFHHVGTWLSCITVCLNDCICPLMIVCGADRELQDPSNKQYILCDEKLRQLTGEDRFKAFGFAKYFKKYFTT